MGNVDMTIDQKLMQKHTELVADFRSHTPLYNVQDIKFPLSTKGIKIVDATGRRVKLSGGNWSGAHMCRHCVDGLEFRPLRDIAMDIRYKFKMNCIRLTYSLQMFYDNKVIPEKYLKANPELIGKTGMEIFDITVATLTDVGLMVLLNNHTSSSQWCCSNDDGDGLWWSREFPEYKFFENCEEFARRYSNNPRVIGMDLRNELRKANGLDTTWGDGNPLTDWHRAATICGEKVLKIAPHWLIMVSGVNYQLDLTGVQKTTINYSVPNKLVYTGHFYGFSWPIPSWTLVSYQDFKKKLFNSQTFVRAMGYPFFLGEYGNNCKDVPWNYLIRYLKETDIDWTYWALDGFKCQPQTDETYGVFTNDFKEARHPDLLEDMISVGPPPGTIIERPKHNNKQSHEGQRFQPRTETQHILRKEAPRNTQEQRRFQQPLLHVNRGTMSPTIVTTQGNVGYQGYQPQGNINNTGNNGLNVGTSNIDPRFLLSMQTLTKPQQLSTNPQIVQIPQGQTQTLQQVQYQPQQRQQTYLEQPNTNNPYTGGFTGAKASSNQAPVTMTSSIRSNIPYNPNVGQQTNQQYTYVQQPLIQPNIYTSPVGTNQPTYVNQPQQGQQVQQGQQGQQGQRNVMYFDSNGRPILR